MKRRMTHFRLTVLGLFGGGMLLQTGGCGFDSALFVNSSLSIIISNIATNYVATSLAQWLNVSEGFRF